MMSYHHFNSTSDPDPQNLIQVGWVLSSLCNQTVAGSDSSDISSAIFGIHFFNVESMTFQFLYSLYHLYDYILNRYYE